MTTVGLACGPTGGHILPAKLIAESLRTHSVSPILFTGDRPVTRKLLDGRLPLTTVDVKPWAGVGPLSKLRSIGSIGLEYLRLRHRFRELDGLISLGGHSALPCLIGAREQSIPTFVQEQNTVMGRANRLFLNQALEVFQGLPPVSGEEVPARGTLTGNPVRPAGTPPDDWFDRDPLLVVVGGSQGSRNLSRILGDTGGELLDRGWSIFHVRGGNGLDLTTRDWGGSGNFRQVEFSRDLNRILPAADCLWSRSGAGTLAEILQYDLPALLFPYPHAADDHQRKNAEWVRSVGPSVIMDEERRQHPSRLLELTDRLADETGGYRVPWDRTELPQDRIARSVVSRL